MAQKVDGKPRRRGHPLTLTDAIAAELVDYMENGAYISGACAMARVPRATYYKWLALAKRDRLAGKDNILTRFESDIRAAEARAQYEAIQAIRAAAAGHPKADARAAVEFLKRRNAAEWGTQTTIKIDAQKGLTAMLEAVESHMSKGAYDEMLAALAAIRAGEAPGSDETVH